MSILIKGMEMPRNCYECKVWFECFDEKPHFNMIKSVCPLVEVKTPHGRLIDADKLLEKAYWDYNEATHDYNNIKVVSEYDIDDAPTVIEAEGSETE